MNTECVLATLPSSTDRQRVVVVLTRDADGSTRFVLRQQNWADGLGWYDQTSLELEPQQLRQLANVLGPNRLRREFTAEEPAVLAFPCRVESA